MGGSKIKASDREKQEIGNLQAIGKCERQASDGEEQEADEWWRRVRDRRVVEKSERQASDGEDEETRN